MGRVGRGYRDRRAEEEEIKASRPLVRPLRLEYILPSVSRGLHGSFERKTRTQVWEQGIGVQVNARKAAGREGDPIEHLLYARPWAGALGGDLSQRH